MQPPFQPEQPSQNPQTYVPYDSYDADAAKPQKRVSLLDTFIIIGIVAAVSFITFGLLVLLNSPDWRIVTSKEGKFSVLMPLEPEIKNKKSDTALGQVDLFIFSKFKDGVGYSVSYNDYPIAENGNSQIALDSIAVNLRESHPEGTTDAITFKSINFINLDGIPGRELNYIFDKFTVKHRGYFLNKRLYQLVVIMDKPNDDTNKNAQKFFDSFKILK